MHDFLSLLKKMGVLRKYVFLLILRSPFDAARAWMLANLMKTVFLCLETDKIDGLPEVCVSYGLLCALLFLYNGTVWSIYAAFCSKLEAGLQKKMIQKILTLPYRYVESQKSGEWITKLNSDIQAVCTMMNGALNIPHFVVAALNTALLSVLMFQSSVLLFCVIWILAVLHLFVNYRIILKDMPHLREESLKAMAESTSAIKPLITEAETILMYHAGGLMMKKCEESSRRFLKINQNIHMKNALSSAILRLFGCGGFFLALLIGCRFILDGAMSFSDVVYCLQVRAAILSSLFMLTVSMNNIKANLVCVKRINRVYSK